MIPNAADAAHDDLRELIGAYALDALEQDERAALRAHLVGCPGCRAELADLRMAVANLPLLLDEMEPPPALRDRLEADLRADLAVRNLAGRSGQDRPAPVADVDIDRPATRGASPLRPLPMPEPIEPRPRTVVPTPIQTAPSKRAVVPWAAAAALLLVVSVGLLLWNLRLQDQAGAPAGETVALVPADAAAGATGELRIDPEADLLVLEVQDLPPLEQGEVYQVWLIGNGEPEPFGVFAAPTARHAIAADPGAYQTLAITNEPGPLGLPGPTGEVVATVPLGG